MKSSIKTIVVECKSKISGIVKEFDVDSDIFDDVHLEAATRFAEEHVRKPNAKISPILSTYEKKDAKDYDKHLCLNSYFVIINAGFHQKAENMRLNFKKQFKIDLAKESLKSKNQNGQ
jgi:hypothetical protein